MLKKKTTDIAHTSTLVLLRDKRQMTICENSIKLQLYVTLPINFVQTRMLKVFALPIEPYNITRVR